MTTLLQSLSCEMRRSDLALALRNTESETGLICKRHPFRRISPRIRLLDSSNPERTSAQLKMSWQNYTHGAWRFHGRLITECLVRAAKEIARRHSILRCTIEHLSGEWVYIAEEAPEPSIFEFIADEKMADREIEASSFLARNLWRPFDFSSEGPFRLIYASISETEHLIAFVIHHMFADAYSDRICSYELAQLYEAYSHELAPSLREPSLQYFDYLLSMEEWNRSPSGQAYIARWLDYLNGARAVPLTGSGAMTFSGTSLGKDSSRCLREFCSIERIGANIVWEAAHHLALSRLSGETDITTQTRDVGRRQRELVGVVGFLTDVTFSRSRMDRGQTFRQLVRRVREDRLAAFKFWIPNALIPFDKGPPTGQLNFIPREFLPLPSFGEIIHLAPPAGLSTDVISGIDLPAGYAINIYDGEDFSVVCLALFNKPFTPMNLIEALAEVTHMAIANPDVRISDLLTAKA